MMIFGFASDAATMEVVPQVQEVRDKVSRKQRHWSC